MDETTQPQVEISANQPEVAAEESKVAEPFLTVKYNKEDTTLSKEDATTYAQKGMNYDKLSGRLEEVTAKLSEYESSDLAQPTKRKASYSARNAQETINGQLSDFMQRNPNVDPRELPKQVLDAWRGGVPLSEAAALHQANGYKSEIGELKKQIKQMNTNVSNAAASMGRPQSNGSTQQQPLSQQAIKNMSKKELARNHERIWEFLTGVKKEK